MIDDSLRQLIGNMQNLALLITKSTIAITGQRWTDCKGYLTMAEEAIKNYRILLEDFLESNNK